MAELSRFDARLEHAVQAFADRAQTSVDAVAVATRASGHRRTGPRVVLGRAVPVPVSVLVLGALLVALAGWSLTGGGPIPVRIWLGPVATPTAVPTPSPTPSPTPNPTPTVAPDAPAYVTGIGIRTVQSAGTTTLDKKGIAHTLGIVIGFATNLDDPRVSGTGTYRLSVDASGSLGFTHGTFRLDVPGGAWAGTCTGSTWNDFGAGDVSCWLVGSGRYAGLTFYLNHRFVEGTDSDRLLGTIIPGEPPSP